MTHQQHRGVPVVVPEGEALSRLLDRVDDSRLAQKLLANLSGTARDGMLRLFARLYQAGLEDGIDNAIEQRPAPARPRPSAPSQPRDPEETAVDRQGVGVRSPVQAVVERYRNSKLTLPHPPDVAVRLNRILEDPDFDIGSVVELVRVDPALTAKVMSLASSPAYSAGRAPRALNDAVMRLGSRELTKYLMALCNRRLFAFQSEWSADRLRDLWHHSLATAILAEQLAGEVEGLAPTQVFLHGLLHDVGRAILVQIFDELESDPQYQGAFTEDEIERTVDGLHGQFGAALLRKWHFDDSFGEVAMFHHQPAKSFAHQNIVSVVSLADAVACHAGFGLEHSGIPEGEPAGHASACYLGIDAAAIEFATHQMKRSYEAMVDLT